MTNLLKVHSTNDDQEEKRFDLSQRAQLLRAVVLGCNEGLMLSSLIVMRMTAYIDKINDLIITGIVGVIAGALAIAVAEYVSVYTQKDVVAAQNKRDRRNGTVVGQGATAPSPIQIGFAAFLAYFIGGFVPILTAFFVRHYVLRFVAVAFTASLSMLGAGYFAATLGKGAVLKSCARVLMGGWMEIAIMIAKRKVLQLWAIENAHRMLCTDDHVQ